MSSDATAVSTQKQSASQSQSRAKVAIIWSGLGLLLVGCIGMLVLWMLGITRGREFDASTWAFRSFTFIRNPLTGKQFSSIHRSADFPVPPSISALAQGGPLAPGARWDLVDMTAGPYQYVGEAQVLLDYLSALDQQNNYFWDAWTTRYPLAAPILWSAVRDCVHLPRYDRLPDIFEAARSTTDPVQLKTKLTQIMLDIAEDEAKLQAKLGNEAAQKRAQTLIDAYLQPASDKPQAEVEKIP